MNIHSVENTFKRDTVAQEAALCHRKPEPIKFKASKIENII